MNANNELICKVLVQFLLIRSYNAFIKIILMNDKLTLGRERCCLEKSCFLHL